MKTKMRTMSKDMTLTLNSKIFVLVQFTALFTVIATSALAQESGGGLLRSYSEAVGVEDDEKSQNNGEESTAPAESTAAPNEAAQTPAATAYGEEENEAGAVRVDPRNLEKVSYRSQYYLKVNGIKDYAQFDRLRQRLEEVLPSPTVVFERVLSRQEKVLAIKTNITPAEMREKTNRLSLEPGPGTLVLESDDEREFQARIR